MARPTNKESLLAQADKNFEELFQLIEWFSVDQQNNDFPFQSMNRNIRDILCHLYEWHLMMKDWYSIGMAGEKPKIPAENYTWKTTPDLNLMIWNKYQTTDLNTAKSLLHKSHRQIMELIRSHTNEELFTKKKYKWTNTTSMGAFFVSATSSHYHWANKMINKYKKLLIS